MVAVQLEVGNGAEHGFQHLIGRHHVVKAHQGHGVLHAGVVGVKGDDVGDAHGLQLLQRDGAVQAFPVGAAVLAAAVQQRHNDAHALGFAAGGLDQTFQVLEMVVRGHKVLMAENLVFLVVIAHVYDEIDIVAAHGGADEALAVAGGKAGAFALDDKRVLAHPGLLRPAEQVTVDLGGELLGAGHGNQAEVGEAFIGVEKFLRTGSGLHHGESTLLIL